MDFKGQCMWELECLFRRIALYVLTHPAPKSTTQVAVLVALGRQKKHSSMAITPEENRALRMGDSDDEEMNLSLFPKKFGNSTFPH
ncbi:hypothetical protein SESBI_37136 [Sesbania bispinosa]|nr:hypothetical protein SESBI_37136 [Sesbania bispinosa]